MFSFPARTIRYVLGRGRGGSGRPTGRQPILPVESEAKLSITSEQLCPTPTSSGPRARGRGGRMTLSSHLAAKRPELQVPAPRLREGRLQVFLLRVGPERFCDVSVPRLPGL